MLLENSTTSCYSFPVLITRHLASMHIKLVAAMNMKCYSHSENIKPMYSVLPNYLKQDQEFSGNADTVIQLIPLTWVFSSAFWTSK